MAKRNVGQNIQVQEEELSSSESTHMRIGSAAFQLLPQPLFFVPYPMTIFNANQLGVWKPENTETEMKHFTLESYGSRLHFE